MKKILNHIICVFVILFIIIFVILFVLFNYMSALTGNSMSETKIETLFTENKVDIVQITNYIMNLEIEKGTITVANDNSSITINNSDISKEINFLFQNKHISAFEKENDYLYVQIGTAKDYSQGVVYSKNDFIPYVHKADRIAFKRIEQNWYYYEIVD